MYSKGLKGRQHVGDLDVFRGIIKFLVTVYRLMTLERPTRKNCLRPLVLDFQLVGSAKFIHTPHTPYVKRPYINM
jgi:hypothetical protein